MHIIVIGAGEVGFHLARRLSAEGQDVVLIESNAERAGFVADHLDVLTLTGDGVSLPILESAGLDDAQMMLAVTNRDEVNALACLAAARRGVKFRAARLKHPEHYPSGGVLSPSELGIDLVVNPERECAWETFQLLNSEAATDLVPFANGQIQLIGLRVREGAVVAGKTLAELDQELAGRSYVTVAIVRDGATEIPTGQSRIEAGDEVFVLTPASQVPGIPPLAGYADFRLRHVMIAGGNGAAVHLAGHLETHGVSCTILERDRARCVELSRRLDRALVLHGDAREPDLLEMEGVEGMDGFVAYTGQDETNMLTCLLAKHGGARKVVSLIDRGEYIRLLDKMGIDAAVSPRRSTVDAILRHVRRGNVYSVATLKGIDAEALELQVDAKAPILGRPLTKVDFPEGAILGAILREDRVILPRGDDFVEAGDRIVLFARPVAIGDLERLFS